ncbi:MULTISPECIES: hypothetical protein [Pseudovibrio]|uniref:hypothetical protein n=1 Tax=Stappiaceae TaxID=2821832 RepID=UPI00236707D7|nr:MULTISPECIES: hypothetical protein [Pseudovibrio]MDD7910189.1 hypothetical protein [Pseudovibrio exalbescens]MDX5593902.1 hypothetical protein [Pseudovibrio sp. SPO723]
MTPKVLEELVKSHRTIRVVTAQEILGLSEPVFSKLIDEAVRRKTVRVSDDKLISQIPQAEENIGVRMHNRFREKDAIGKLAAQQVGANSHLLIESGSTPAYFVKHLNFQDNISISTTSPLIAQSIVVQKHYIEVEVISGSLTPGNSNLHGPEAINRIEQIDADWSIISPVSLNAEQGLAYYFREDILVCEAMQRNGKKTMVIADSYKFGVPSRFSSNVPMEIDLLVTDAGSPAELDAVCKVLKPKEVLLADPETEERSELTLLDT